MILTNITPGFYLMWILVMHYPNSMECAGGCRVVILWLRCTMYLTFKAIWRNWSLPDRRRQPFCRHHVQVEGRGGAGERPHSWSIFEIYFHSFPYLKCRSVLSPSPRARRRYMEPSLRRRLYAWPGTRLWLPSAQRILMRQNQRTMKYVNSWWTLEGAIAI